MQDSNFYTLLNLAFLIVQCTADPFEHVVLANCKSSHFDRISHMAYYRYGLASVPDTIAVVPSPQNETATWIRNSSDPVSAVFPDGTRFVADLSNTTQQGQYAGTGNNGWGTFRCWSYYVGSMYTWYDSVTCDGVYDCNRQVGAGDPGMPNATATVMFTPSATAARNGDQDQDSNSQKSNDIALGVGIGIGLPTLFVTLLSIWFKRPTKLFKHLPLGSTSSEERSEDGQGREEKNIEGDGQDKIDAIKKTEDIGRVDSSKTVLE